MPWSNSHLVWAREHGRPVPKGFFVVHDDGDTLNDEPGNLILVDRKENMRRLYERRPDAIALCRKRAGKATFDRHEARRKLKAAGLVPAKRTFVWECAACGADLAAGTTRCPKCGSLSIESREVAPMPDGEQQAVLARMFGVTLKAG